MLTFGGGEVTETVNSIIQFRKYLTNISMVFKAALDLPVVRGFRCRMLRNIPWISNLGYLTNCLHNVNSY